MLTFEHQNCPEFGYDERIEEDVERWKGFDWETMGEEERLQFTDKLLNRRREAS